MRYHTQARLPFIAAIAVACAVLSVIHSATAQAGTAARQARMHKIVFEMSVDGMPKWESVLRNAENVQKTFGPKNTRIEIVAHGKGIGLLLGKNAAANPEIKKMMQRLHRNGVVFAACNNTLTRLKIDPRELVQVAVIVDSGVAEVVRKQEAGWTYIKSG